MLALHSDKWTFFCVVNLGFVFTDNNGVYTIADSARLMRRNQSDLFFVFRDDRPIIESRWTEITADNIGVFNAEEEWNVLNNSNRIDVMRKEVIG